MLVIVVVLFAACWFPFHIVFIYIEFHPQTYEPTQAIFSLVLFVQWLMFANSACNPLVYAVLNLNYRREFIRILRCQSLAVTKYFGCDSLTDRNNEPSRTFSTAYRNTSRSVALKSRLLNKRLSGDGRVPLETIKEENGNMKSMRDRQISSTEARQSSSHQKSCLFESGL